MKCPYGNEMDATLGIPQKIFAYWFNLILFGYLVDVEKAREAKRGIKK